MGDMRRKKSFGRPACFMLLFTRRLVTVPRTGRPKDLASSDEPLTERGAEPADDTSDGGLRSAYI